MRRWTWLTLCGLSLGALASSRLHSGTANDAMMAVYEVTFQATWSKTSHPQQFPGGAHFSPLVAAVHHQGVRFFRKGKPASPGIEAMAELGATGLLTGEVQAAIDAGDALSFVVGSGTGSPGQVSVQITATQDFPRATVVSMIAPSPDWFVGVSALKLRQGGAWRERIVVPLRAWDAGTDSGPVYQSPDADTQPADNVRRKKKGVFAGGEPLGTLTFERIQ